MAPPAAPRQVHSLQAQPFARHHCNTSTCPHSADSSQGTAIDCTTSRPPNDFLSHYPRTPPHPRDCCLPCTTYKFQGAPLQRLQSKSRYPNNNHRSEHTAGPPGYLMRPLESIFSCPTNSRYPSPTPGMGSTAPHGTLRRPAAAGRPSVLAQRGYENR